MPVQVKFGRRPAVQDDRVPFLRDLNAAKALPVAPASANWYADLGTLGMLGNDTVGDCVTACFGHATQAFTAYAGDPQIPTTKQAIKLYSDITGYVPGDESTDNGTVILGKGGAMEYWAIKGVTFGDATSKAAAYAQIRMGDDAEWIRQGIALFGGVVLGLNLPENVVAKDEIPFVWNDPGGAIAGGHCVWLCGYETVADELLFDLISWGAHYRMTLPFLRGTFEEAVAVFDDDFLNAKGVDPADATAAELAIYMAALQVGG